MRILRVFGINLESSRAARFTRYRCPWSVSRYERGLRSLEFAILPANGREVEHDRIQEQAGVGNSTAQGLRYQRISFAAVYVSARPGRLPPPSGDIAEEDVKTSSSFYQVC
jgi:hypothetical protein